MNHRSRYRTREVNLRERITKSTDTVSRDLDPSPRSLYKMGALCGAPAHTSFSRRIAGHARSPRRSLSHNDNNFPRNLRLASIAFHLFPPAAAATQLRQRGVYVRDRTTRPRNWAVHACGVAGVPYWAHESTRGGSRTRPRTDGAYVGRPFRKDKPARRSAASAKRLLVTKASARVSFLNGYSHFLLLVARIFVTRGSK